tara:strand:- start:288 stop:908 length:621 start_codon:yes stop_codon:yes gene_type:complete
METLKTLTGQQSSDPTLFAVDTLASHLAPQANDKEPTTPDTCGRGCEPPLANYDPTTQSWRMSEDTSLWGDYKSLESLPKSGMTRNGALFQQPEWVRLTNATGLSLLPTPRSSSAMAEDLDSVRERLNNGKKYKSRLEEAVAMWGTPRAAQGESRNHTIYSRPYGKPQNLENQIAQREPSAIGGKLNPAWVEWLMGFPIGWTDLED